MEELYGALIAEKLIDQQLAKNLWDAGFQTVHSLMELPTDVKELRELLQHDCPALQKIGVAYSLVAAIKKLLSGEIRLDTVPKSGRQSTATFTIAHSEPSSITSEKAPSAPEVKQQLNEMHLTNDNSPTNEDKIAAVVTKRIERIESALRETISSIEALRESKPIQKYPALAKELRLDLHSSAISILQRRFKAMLDPVLLQFQSDAVDIDAVDEILDQFEKPLITESKLQETIECLREACSFLQEHLLDAIEQEGIPVEASETTTTTTTIALTLNMGRAQDENYESIKSFIDSSSPKAIFHWPREPTARKFFSKKVADFVSLYRINKSNGNVHFVCNLDSCIPSDSSLSNCRMAIFVQLIEPNRRTLLSLPMSVHPENILADEVTPSTMTLSWQDSMHSNLVGEDDDWRSRLIQGYQIFAISEEEDEEEELVYETKGAEDSCTVEGLHQDTSYRFAIKMICAHDIEVERSEWSHPFRTKREERRALRIKDCAAKVPDHCSANIFHLSRKAVPLSGSGIQKYEIGASSPKDIGKKVLLMIGGTGTGKTTLINSMANYLYEVRPEDPFRFKLISEQDELRECGTHDATKSQTKLVGAYVLNDTRLNYQLTVVDTPGFGDTEGGAQFDRQTVAYIKSWFSQRGAAGISQIDGICIVVKSTDVAINAHVRHELTSIVELFGKHMEQNILIMFTFSDTAKPPAIYALKNAGIPIDRAFKFNNSAVFEQYIDASDDLSGDEHDNASLRKIFWDMGMRSFHEFFKQLDNVPSGSLCMSLETLKTREMLEQQTLRLSERIKEELERAKNISETIEMLVNNKSAIDCNRDFAIKLKQYRAEKRPVGDSERCALTCLNCNFSCLKQCSRAEGLEIQWSVIMRRSMELMSEQSLPESSASNAAHAPNEEQIRVQKESATCAVCPAKCHWSAHAICDYVIEYEEVVVEEKIADLMERYQVDPESGEKTITQMLAEKMARALVEKEQEMRDIVAEIRVRLNQLNEIDMTPEQSTTDLAYFLMLLEGEKADMLPGYHKRIAILERQLSLLQPRHSLSDDADSTAIQYLNDKYPQLYELTVSNEQDVPATNAIARLHARNKGDDSDDDNPASAEKLSPMKMHLKFWRDMGL